MKFGTDGHGTQRMNLNDFGVPLTFHLAPPAGQRFHLSSEISQHLQIDWHKIWYRHSWFLDDVP